MPQCRMHWVHWRRMWFYCFVHFFPEGNTIEVSCVGGEKKITLVYQFPLNIADRFPTGFLLESWGWLERISCGNRTSRGYQHNRLSLRVSSDTTNNNKVHILEICFKFPYRKQTPKKIKRNENRKKKKKKVVCDLPESKLKTILHIVLPMISFGPLSN